MENQGIRHLYTGKRKTAFIQKHRTCNSVGGSGCLPLWDLKEYVVVIEKNVLANFSVSTIYYVTK